MSVSETTATQETITDDFEANKLSIIDGIAFLGTAIMVIGMIIWGVTSLSETIHTKVDQHIEQQYQSGLSAIGIEPE